MKLDSEQNITLVAHADWSKDPGKRWITIAKRQSDGGFIVKSPFQITDSSQLLPQLRSIAGPKACVLLGFDFPIGLPFAYAEQIRADNFLELLPKFGKGEWAEFYEVAATPDEISFSRPFYPMRPGGTSHKQLITSLGARSIHQLRRKCEMPHPGRRAANPLFWTLGGQQVGKAAISGWKEVLVPGLCSHKLKIWPFSGHLNDLLVPGEIVAVETYPAEAYKPIGIEFKRARSGNKTGKRAQASRLVNAQVLLDYVQNIGAVIDQKLLALITDGFGHKKTGEDLFDSFVGLIWMLHWLNRDDFPEPKDKIIRHVEGWIFGQSISHDG